MAGDGDQITVGDMTNVTGAAVGRGAQAHVTQGVSVEELAKLFSPIYQQIQTRPADRDVDKVEVKDTVQKIEAEATKGEQASPSRVERLFTTLGLMAPDILEVTAAALSGPQAVVSTT